MRFSNPCCMGMATSGTLMAFAREREEGESTPAWWPNPHDTAGSAT